MLRFGMCAQCSAYAHTMIGYVVAIAFSLLFLFYSTDTFARENGCSCKPPSSNRGTWFRATNSGVPGLLHTVRAMDYTRISPRTKSIRLRETRVWMSVVCTGHTCSYHGVSFLYSSPQLPAGAHRCRSVGDCYGLHCCHAVQWLLMASLPESEARTQSPLNPQQ